MRAFVVGVLLVSIAIPAAYAGQPSAVLPKPSFRPSLPISVAPASPKDADDEMSNACEFERVMRIERGNAQAIDGGISFDAYGLADSAGWMGPKLVLADQDRGVATVDFVACAPRDAADAVTPVETHIALGLDPDTHRVIIRSRTNTLSIDVED